VGNSRVTRALQGLLAGRELRFSLYKGEESSPFHSSVLSDLAFEWK